MDAAGAETSVDPDGWGSGSCSGAGELDGGAGAPSTAAEAGGAVGTGSLAGACTEGAAAGSPLHAAMAERASQPERTFATLTWRSVSPILARRRISSDSTSRARASPGRRSPRCESGCRTPTYAPVWSDQGVVAASRIATAASLSGVATPCARPSRTTTPLRASISSGRPARRSARSELPAAGEVARNRSRM